VLSHAVNHRANTLQVWVPAATARIIRVTDHIAKTRPFAAKLTSHGHKYSSPHRQNSHKARSLAKFRLLRTLFVDFAACGKSPEDAAEENSPPCVGQPVLRRALPASDVVVSAIGPRGCAGPCAHRDLACIQAAPLLSRYLEDLIAKADRVLARDQSSIRDQA
jgi:hypothetical protein